MNAPITFPPIPSDEVSDDPLIIEAKVAGYLVRRVFVDQGAAIQVMFEHCFDNLPASVRANLVATQTELVGFSGEQLLPLGKIELEVAFGTEGLSRRMMMKFTVVKAASPYNIILERTGMRDLRAVSSTIHAMVKFPTPRGIATLSARTAPVYECRWSEKRSITQKTRETEEAVLVNSAFPEQKVTIGTQFSPDCRLQLINLLKNTMDVFAWEPTDMVGVPK
ncbi:reverse transcriptase domain-containing protein [Tanacetum coccineum]